MLVACWASRHLPCVPVDAGLSQCARDVSPPPATLGGACRGVDGPPSQAVGCFTFSILLNYDDDGNAAAENEDTSVIKL